jgi:hypothetical protein
MNEAFWSGFEKEAASTQALKRLGKLGRSDPGDFLRGFGKTQTTQQGVMKKIAKGRTANEMSHPAHREIVDEKKMKHPELRGRIKKAGGAFSTGRTAIELGGLGVLMAPAVAHLGHHEMSEDHKAIAEVAGLGGLMAPYAYDAVKNRGQIAHQSRSLIGRLGGAFKNIGRIAARVH